MKVSSKIAGTHLYEPSDLKKVRSVRKAQSVLADLSHPLRSEFVLLQLGCIYNLPRCRTNRFNKSIIPVALGLVIDTQ